MVEKTTAIVVRWGALGDMVMATPVLRALAKRYGHPCTVVCLGAWAQLLYQGLPSVAAVHVLASRKRPYWFSPDQWQLVRILQPLRGRPTYVMAGDKRAGSLMRRAGMTIAGSGDVINFVPNEHQVDYQARIAGFAPESYDRHPELTVAAEELAECRTWLRPLVGDAPVVVVQVGNKRTMGRRVRSNNVKHWPLDRWVSVVRGVLASDSEIHVLFNGSLGEREMTDEIVAAVNDPRAHSVAGQVPIRRMLALLSLAHSSISVDTGPAHVAAAVGCPLVVLFGATDPRLNAPLATTAPVRIVTGPPGAPIVDGDAGWCAHHHMDGITAEAVLVAWHGLILAVFRRS